MSDAFPISAVFGGADDARAYARVPLERRLGAFDMTGLFELAARERGEALALRFLPRGLPSDTPVDLSFAQLHRNFRRAVGTLDALGIQPGDVIAMLLPNHPLTITAVLAAQATGVAAPINAYLEPKDIAGLLEAMSARYLLADGEQARQKLAAILALCPRPPRVLSLDELHQEGVQDRPGQAVAGRRDRRNETVGLFHTGGTTGLPKLVPLRGFNLAAMFLMSAYAYGYGPQDTVLAAMPMFHVGGLLASVLFPLACGARVLLLGEEGYRGKGTVAATWLLAQREAVSVLIGPPTVIGQLAQAMPRHADVPALRMVVNGAAPLPTAIGDRVADGLGVVLTEPWGLTEATLAVTSMPHTGRRRSGSVGVALPYCGVKAVKVDGADQEVRDCGVDEVGVLAIKGPTVFAGYPGRPLEQQPWFKDGWLNTGDLGRVDADGFVWITGRAKDLIKRGGHGIDPAVVEAAFYARPEVALAAAVGRPDAYAGELPVIYIQLKPGAAISEQALLEAAAPAIHERAAIPKEVFILPALPLTGVGKINKQALRLDAARRTFADALGAQGLVAGSFELDVAAHSRFGTLVTARVPAVHMDIARGVLERYAFTSQVLELGEQKP